MDENNKKPLDETTAQWYVVSTYSGYEIKVKDKIEMLIENKQDENVFDVKVPMQEYVETKGNQRVVKERKLWPGYVLIKMNITPTSWFLIRNTRGVTSFVGPGGEPVPLTKKEMKSLGVKDQVKKQIDVKPGDRVKVIDGIFKHYTVDVEEVNKEKGTIKGIVSMFGRDTSVDIDFDDVEKI